MALRLRGIAAPWHCGPMELQPVALKAAPMPCAFGRQQQSQITVVGSMTFHIELYYLNRFCMATGR